MLQDRDLRQRDLIPPDRLAACRPTVVGIGAIGRQVCLQLAAMGVPWLQLIDHDTVEAANLGPQGYLQDDIGRRKVNATADLCQQLNHMLAVEEIAERFRRSQTVGDVLFCAVDSIETRRLIWAAVKTRVRLFIDGRMNAEVLRILAAGDEGSRRHYPTTLFTAAEAHAGPCTARSTIYTANIAAGLMVGQFAKWLRGLPVEADVQLNLLAGEWAVNAVQP